MIKVINNVNVLESNGKPAESNSLEIQINSHWNRNEMVVLVTPGGEQLTVFAKDILAGVNNATNSNRF